MSLLPPPSARRQSVSQVQVAHRSLLGWLVFSGAGGFWAEQGSELRPCVFLCSHPPTQHASHSSVRHDPARQQRDPTRPLLCSQRLYHLQQGPDGLYSQVTADLASSVVRPTVSLQPERCWLIIIMSVPLHAPTHRCGRHAPPPPAGRPGRRVRPHHRSTEHGCDWAGACPPPPWPAGPGGPPTTNQAHDVSQPASQRARCSPRRGWAETL